MAGRDPSREERALWRRAMGGVKPLTPAERTPPQAPPEGAPPKVSQPKPRPHAPPKAKPPPPLPALEPGASPGFDRRSAEKFRRGEMAIEARLDLHGHSQAEAHQALQRFVERAANRGLRMLLVVTGKGTVRGAGVLRAAAPRWLNEPALRPLVLSFAWAQPKDGGSGALYVLLRRKRAAE